MTRQRGFGLVAQIIAGGVAVVLAAGAFAYYNHVVAERARLELELSDAVKANQEQAAAISDLRAERKRLEAVLAEREEERQAHQIERGLLNAEIQELRDRKPEVRKWMDAPVPADVLERVRRRPANRGADPGGKAVPAPAAAGPDR